VIFDTTDPTGGMVRAGQKVRLAVVGQPGQPPSYLIQDFERGRPLLVLAALFVGAVVAFGRWQGVRSLIGLGLSFLVIVGFVIPAILRGHSPVLVAVTGAMAIMLISLYLIPRGRAQDHRRGGRDRARPRPDRRPVHRLCRRELADRADQR
jgi:uncharacterized membrane protein